MSDLARLSPAEFRDALLHAGISRCFLVWDAEAQRLVASHALLEPLARLLEADKRDFEQHEGVFLAIGSDTRALHGAFVHRTCRGQAAGGVRLWSYATVEDYLRDGLRLARGMTHKNALAGLWWGGGKGVIARETAEGIDSRSRRDRLYEEYGALVSALRGCYVTAEDVGTAVEDMACVFRTTRFTTCIPPEVGGSGNPSVPTALGVVRGMEAALAHRGTPGLAGKSVAIEGLGHVGEPLVEFLLARGVIRIVGADVSAARVSAIGERFGERVVARVVPCGDASILAEDVDIVSPCATGATLNPRSIPAIRARIVCGAANNQLEDPQRDDRSLADRGVTYVPDFLVNRMGIVTCADEESGSIDEDPRITRHLGESWDNAIFPLTLRVLREAEARGVSPHRVALEMAEARSLEPHPVWGHRGRTIIASLARGGFCT